MIFKTNTAHATGKKPERGQECATVTAKVGAREKLLVVGAALEENGHSNLDFDEDHLALASDINNAVKSCALIDIALRYADQFGEGGRRGLGGVRWFFRPIAAYWSGHRGLSTKSPAPSSKAANSKAPQGVSTVIGKRIIKAKPLENASTS